MFWAGVVLGTFVLLTVAVLAYYGGILIEIAILEK
jgi:hypothetical protein